MLSREDMLQELELLPVWQSRQPAPLVTREAKPTVSAVAGDIADKQNTEKELEVPKGMPSFRLIVSGDTQWAFILAPQQSKEAEALFQNMLKAISINVSQDIVGAQASLLNQYTPKVIVVMGEVEAQQLLNDQQTLEQLRGKTHAYENVSVITTYTASHLLQHWQDKAKAWEDLCLAKLTIANL